MGDVITLTYSWFDDYDHGICGHTYEVIDYFYILSKHFDVRILLVVNFSIEYFRDIIKNKYDFTEAEINNIIENTIIKTAEEVNNIRFIQSKIVLLTDGIITKKQKFLTNKIVCFPCFEKFIYEKKVKDLIILQDDRIYPQTPNSIHYVKKILLDKIKKPTKFSDKKLLYTNGERRNTDISKYNSSEIVCISKDDHIPGYTYLDIPVDNVFDEFCEYIYTPVSQKFDCSPRFVVECAYFNKKVTYDIDYIDIGLETRKKDIENDLLSLNLKDDDYIVEYMKSII